MKKEKNKSSKKLSIIIISITGLLMGANLLVSNILATSGEQLESLINRKSNLVEQNNLLRKQVIMQGSLENILNKAYELGMLATIETQSITPAPPVAMNLP